MQEKRVLIVGNPAPFHVGAHFANAARTLGCQVTFADSTTAYSGNFFARKLSWHLFGRRPAKLRKFSEDVLELASKPKTLLLATGIAPLNGSTLRSLRERGVTTANFLTDDPWNPAHRAKWFLHALPDYDFIFTPRRANMDQLREHGCREVSYLPFAYAPEIHFPEQPTDSEAAPLKSDIMFAGGADRDRVPSFVALAKSGMDVALFGHDWQKHRQLRRHFRGRADPSLLRKAVGAAGVCPCVVRRANRDGHAMRSYEVPAMKGVILAEQTDDHRQIFGDEGDCALFFSGTAELVEKAKWLLAHQAEAYAMAKRACERVTAGKNTYRDRLEEILNSCLPP
jgi:spore maturation protein CgeB